MADSSAEIGNGLLGNGFHDLNLEIEIETYSYLKHIALLEEVAASNLQKPQPHLYNSLIKNRLRLETSINDLYTQIEKDETPSKKDAIAISSILDSIDNAIQHKTALSTDEKLRYNYCKNTYGLLILDHLGIEKDINQVTRKRDARKFLWDLLRITIQGFTIQKKDEELLLIILNEVLKIIEENTKFENGEDPKIWLKKYSNALNQFKKFLFNKFKEKNYLVIFTLKEKLKLSTAIEAEIGYTWEKPEEDEILLTLDSLEDFEKYARAREKMANYLNEYRRNNDDPIRQAMYFQSFLVAHNMKNDAEKEFYNKHRIQRKWKEWNDAKGFWSTSEFINQNTADFQNMLGHKLGYSLGRGKFKKAFKDPKVYFQLGVSILGPMISTLPGGIVLQSFLSGLFEGMSDKENTDLSPEQVVEKIVNRINQLENHIDEQFLLLKDDIKIQNLYSQYRTKVKDQKTLLETKFTTLILQKISYDDILFKEERLSTITVFLNDFETTLSSILKDAIGCNLDDFLKLGPLANGNIKKNNLSLVNESSKTIKQIECYLGAIKKKHIDYPQKYPIEDFTKEVDKMIRSLKEFFTFLFSIKDSVVEILSILYIVEGDLGRKQSNKDFYKSVLNSTFSFDKKHYVNGQDLKQRLIAQLDNTVSFLIGKANAGIVESIFIDSYFYMYPQHIDNREKMVLGIKKDDGIEPQLVIRKRGDLKRLGSEKRNQFKFIKQDNNFLLGNKYSNGTKFIFQDKKKHEDKLSVVGTKKSIPKYFLELTDNDGSFNINLCTKENEKKLSIDVFSFETKENSSVVLYDKNQKKNQEFKLIPVDDTYIDVNDITDLMLSSTYLHAYFEPGREIRSQIKYSSNINNDWENNFYIILNNITNNLEIRKEDNSLIWRAIENPPNSDFILTAQFTYEGNLIVKKYKKDAPSEQKGSIAWQSGTEGFINSILRLYNNQGHPVLQIVNKNGWVIWQSQPSYHSIDSKGKPQYYDDPIIDNKIFSIKTTLKNIVKRTYKRGIPTDKTVNLDVILKAKTKNRVHWVEDTAYEFHSENGRKFKFKLIDANRFIYQIICIDFNSEHAVACIKDGDTYKLELQRVNKSNEEQLFYIPENNRLGTGIRPKALLNTEYTFQYEKLHTRMAGEDKAFKSDVLFEDSDFFSNAFKVSIREAFYKRVHDFISHSMTAACFNKDENQYYFISSSQCWVRKVGRPCRMQDNIYTGKVFPGLHVNTPIKAAFYVSKETSYYFFHGPYYIQHKGKEIVDSGLVEDKWGVNGEDVSSVCYNEWTNILYFFFKKQDTDSECKYTECEISGKADKSRYNISQYWFNLPGIEFSAVLYNYKNGMYYFFSDNNQYTLEQGKKIINSKIINNDNW